MKTNAKTAATRKATAKRHRADRSAAKKVGARAPVHKSSPRAAMTKPAASPQPTTVRARPGTPRRATSRSAKGPLIIDATNVICGPQNASRLDVLLSLVVAAVNRGRDVLCIFDATTPHRLQTSTERDLYRWLLQDKAHHFIQCPGRTQADALILAEANRMRCQVVSNDFFRDREEQFPWVRDKDRVLRHQPIRDVLYVDDVAIAIEPDLRALKGQIDRLFA